MTARPDREPDTLAGACRRLLAAIGKQPELAIAAVWLVFAAICAMRFPWHGLWHDDACYVTLGHALANGDYCMTQLPGSPAETRYPPLHPAALALCWELGATPGHAWWFVVPGLVIAAIGIWLWGRLLHLHLQLRAAPRAAVLVLAANINRGVLPALSYAKSISQDVRAVYVEQDPEATARLHAKWEKWGMEIPLVVLESPYRSLTEPVLRYIDQVEAELARLGLAHEEFTIRMTGCPNGCARPYNCDVGLVGKARGKYTVFLGGRLLGDRLNFVYKDLVPEEEVASTLAPVFAYFKLARENGETLGDFCLRKGAEDLAAWSEANAAALAR